MQTTAYSAAFLLITLLGSCSQPMVPIASGTSPQELGLKTITQSNAINAWDGDLSTAWKARGTGATLTNDLGQRKTISSVLIAWNLPQSRVTTFDIETSLDGNQWTRGASGLSSAGTPKTVLAYPITPTSARFLRIINRQNTEIVIAELQVAATASQIEEIGINLPVAKRSFYVDCLSGSNRADGLNQSTALQSLASINALALLPGDHVLFKRDCTFAGPLLAARSGKANEPIVYTAYGDGPSPLITLNTDAEAVLASGQHLIFDHLAVKTSATKIPATASKCITTPVAWRVGFELSGQFNVVQHSSASGFMAGIRLSADNNRVLGNVLNNNNVMKKNTASIYDDDSGAWGVLINADNNEVAYNTFSGNWACSEDYGKDGASIELYQASHNSVHHNLTTEDITFTELGGTPTAQSEYNSFAYNTYAPVRGGGAFIVLRGLKSKWGGNPGTVFQHNIGYMVDLGIICSDGCSPNILQANNNILWQRDVPSGLSPNVTAMWADASFMESNNVFWKSDGRPTVSIDNGTLNVTDRIIDPLFTNAIALDFRSPYFARIFASVR